MRRLSTLLAAIAIVGAAPATAQTGWTGLVTTISSPESSGRTIGAPKIAVRANGDAYAVWNETERSDSAWIQMARYSASTGTWSVPITLSGPGRFLARALAVDHAGNAFVVASHDSGVAAIRLLVGSGLVVTTPLDSRFLPDTAAEIVVDTSGNATVMWSVSAGLQTSRYLAATDVWGTTKLVEPGEIRNLQLAIDGVNQVTAVWRRGPPAVIGYLIQAARFDPETETLGPITQLTMFDQHPQQPRVVADPQGNATLIWQGSNGTRGAIRTARYSAASMRWSAVTDISASGNERFPQLAGDPDGNRIAAWINTDFSLGKSIVQAARFSAVTGSWGLVAPIRSP